MTKNVFLKVAGGFALAGLVVTAIGCGSAAPTTNVANTNAPAKPVATNTAAPVTAPAANANTNAAKPAATNAPVTNAPTKP